MEGMLTISEGIVSRVQWRMCALFRSRCRKRVWILLNACMSCSLDVKSTKCCIGVVRAYVC